MSTAIAPFKEYLDKDISTIPCAKVWDEKKKIYTAKVPAISQWSKFCDELPTEDEIDSWKTLSNVWGMAIVAGEASNICCVDIDTEDKQLQARILETIPYTPLVIDGDPRRGGKHIFRLYDTPHDYVAPANLKIKIADPMHTRRSAVDLFFGNAYLCAPPSLHSEAPNGDRHFYKWRDPKMNFDTVPFDMIPVLDYAIVDKLSMVVNQGMTEAQMKPNLPLNLDLSGAESNAEGRWDQMKTLTSQLIRNRTPIEEAVICLLNFDENNFKNNPYFMDKTKGCQTISPRINAYHYYSSMLVTVNRKKMVTDHLEAPRVSNPEYAGDYTNWGKVTPIAEKYKPIAFNPEWIPENIRPMVMRSAEATAVSPQHIFFYMMGTFSSLLGNKVVIQPYHLNKEYTETSNLYVGLVAKSGERKTEITKIARKALMKVQKEAKDWMNKQIKENTFKNEAIKIRKAKLEKEIKQEIEDVGIDSPNLQPIKDEIDNLSKQVFKARDISLYEQENTAEKYYEVSENNPNGIFLEFNEWGAMYDQLLTKDYKKLRRFIMDGWDGQNPFSYKTKQNGENLIDKLCLSVGFSVQEDIMSSIIWRLLNIGRENDGLMQRFMLILSDDGAKPVLDDRLVLDEAFYQIFRNAYFIEASEDRVLLELDAYEAWLTFQQDNKNKRVQEKVSSLESFLSKYDGMIIRIASNIAHLKNNGQRINKITIEDFNTAKEIINYLESNVRCLFKRGEFKKYNEIINCMKMSIIPDGIAVRDLTKKHIGLFGRTSEEAMEKLAELHKHNYVRIVKHVKSYKVLINPELLEGE